MNSCTSLVLLSQRWPELIRDLESATGLYVRSRTGAAGDVNIPRYQCRPLLICIGLENKLKLLSYKWKSLKLWTINTSFSFFSILQYSCNCNSGMLRRLFEHPKEPSNIHTPVWGSPILLIDDTRLKSSYLWVHELLKHFQVHGACDCRYTKKENGPMILSFIKPHQTFSFDCRS